MKRNTEPIDSPDSSSLPNIVSIQVGRPRPFDAEPDAEEKPWSSGIIKKPIEGSVTVRFTNIDGDEQADLKNHGGPDKAVLAYPHDNFSFWQKEFPDIDWQSGSFGENLTLSNTNEDNVCVGDVYSVGECLLQVSQPRQRCWKLSRRWQLPKLAVRVQQTRRTGWYLRVLQEGEIKAGQPMQLVERRHERWTITACNDVMYARPRDNKLDLELAGCQELSTSWKQMLTRRSSKPSNDPS